MSFWLLKLCCLSTGERESASAELSTENSELSSSHQQLSSELTSELEDSRQQLSATQDELHRSAQAAESWQSQLAALQASSAAETASLRQQLTGVGMQTAEEEEKAQAAQRDADKWKRQFEAVQASSQSATAAAAQVRESCNTYCCLAENAACCEDCLVTADMCQECTVRSRSVHAFTKPPFLVHSCLCCISAVTQALHLSCM